MVPSTPPFFPLLSPPYVVFSLPPLAVSLFPEMGLTKELPLYSYLIPNKTFCLEGLLFTHDLVTHKRLCSPVPRCECMQKCTTHLPLFLSSSIG